MARGLRMCSRSAGRLTRRASPQSCLHVAALPATSSSQESSTDVRGKGKRSAFLFLLSRSRLTPTVSEQGGAPRLGRGSFLSPDSLLRGTFCQPRPGVLCQSDDNTLSLVRESGTQQESISDSETGARSRSRFRVLDSVKGVPNPKRRGPRSRAGGGGYSSPRVALSRAPPCQARA